MERAWPARGLLSSAFLLTIIPAAVASAVAVYVFYAVQPTRGADGGDRAAQFAPVNRDLSAEERRELTRQMLKERRENPDLPAEVRPTPSLHHPPALAAEAAGSAGKAAATGGAAGAASSGAAANTGNAISATDGKSRSERIAGAAAAPTVPPIPMARPAIARPRPEAQPAAVAAASLPTSGTTAPPGAGAAGAPADRPPFLPHRRPREPPRFRQWS